MKDLFPSQNLEAGPFTIITLAQRTDNDMSKWSSQVRYLISRDTARLDVI
jgi:hypothetical protein